MFTYDLEFNKSGLTITVFEDGNNTHEYHLDRETADKVAAGKIQLEITPTRVTNQSDVTLATK